MKAEFLKDENGNIWFFFAHDVHVKPPKTKHLLYELKPCTQPSKDQKRDLLLREIEEYSHDKYLRTFAL